MTQKAILKKQIEQLPGIESVELVCVDPETSDHMTIHVYFDPELIVDRLTPEEVAQRNYKATERRGLINELTIKHDFIDKLKEEVDELELAFLNRDKSSENEELADISHVCDAYAQHYCIDLQAEKERIMLINELRK